MQNSSSLIHKKTDMPQLPLERGARGHGAGAGAGVGAGIGMVRLPLSGPTSAATLVVLPSLLTVLTGVGASTGTVAFVVTGVTGSPVASMMSGPSAAPGASTVAFSGLEQLPVVFMPSAQPGHSSGSAGDGRARDARVAARLPHSSLDTTSRTRAAIERETLS